MENTHQREAAAIKIKSQTNGLANTKFQLTLECKLIIYRAILKQ